MIKIVENGNKNRKERFNLDYGQLMSAGMFFLVEKKREEEKLPWGFILFFIYIYILSVLLRCVMLWPYEYRICIFNSDTYYTPTWAWIGFLYLQKYFSIFFFLEKKSSSCLFLIWCRFCIRRRRICKLIRIFIM